MMWPGELIALCALVLSISQAQAVIRRRENARKASSSEPKNALSLTASSKSSSGGGSSSRGSSKGSIATASSSSSGRRLSIPTNTNWGTTECKHWPNFYLQDYQPESGEDYLESYGLGELLPLADVTIVGLYFADAEECRIQATRQNDLTADLAKANPDIVVHNVMLNFYMPYSCITTECTPSYINYPFFLPWYTDQCYGYVGGCSPTDPALSLEKWQTPLSNVTTMPFFQDTEWDNVWDDFGGGKGDIFIYDGVGRLYTYICNSANGCSTNFPASLGPLTNETAYNYVIDQALEAAKSNGTERCKTFKDDDNPTPIVYDDVWYYYYYYENVDDDDKKGDDDKKSDDDKKGDDDKKSDDDKSDDTAAAATEGDANGMAKGDDDGDDDDGDDDTVPKAQKKHNKSYKGYGTGDKKGIPSYVLASLIAVLAFGVSAGIFYLRRRFLQDSGMTASTYYGGGTGHKFDRLPTAEGSDNMPDNQLEVEMRAPGRGSKDDGSYGSL